MKDSGLKPTAGNPLRGFRVTIRRRPVEGQAATEIESKEFALRPTRAARSNGWHAGIARQPEPKIPGISKIMIRQHLPKLIERGVLKRKPASVSDWLMAEWHLAKELKVSPIRLAYFVSEVLTEPEGFRHVLPLLAASR